MELLRGIAFNGLFTGGTGKQQVAPFFSTDSRTRMRTPPPCLQRRTKKEGVSSSCLLLCSMTMGQYVADNDDHNVAVYSGKRMSVHEHQSTVEFIISLVISPLQTRTPWEEQGEWILPDNYYVQISYCRLLYLPWPLCETNHLCRRCSLLLLHWTLLNLSSQPMPQCTRMSVSIAYGLW